MDFKNVEYKIPIKQECNIKMCKIRQKFNTSKIADITGHVHKELSILDLPSLENKKIAVTAGSRGIANIAEIIKSVVDFLKNRNAEPFIIPAMGSHGGGTAEGQRDVLTGYLITEETMGVPVISDMETVFIGETLSGIKIACDRSAFEADYIVVINRIKAHSDFKAQYESGLCKMMMVGLGKHTGAATVHRAGSLNFGQILPDAADVFIKTGKILFGLALVENAKEETSIAECIPTKNIIKREKELLVLAKEMQARLYINGADLLIIDEIGKNISGAGMDPNVTGRPPTGALGFPDQPAKQIAVLGITECSGGNAIGIGMADIITVEMARKIEFSSTYTNALTAGVIAAGRLPMVANSDWDALLFSAMATGKKSVNELKIIHIKNTMEIEIIEISKNLLNDVLDKQDKIQIVSDFVDLKFDFSGRLNRLSSSY